MMIDKFIGYLKVEKRYSPATQKAYKSDLLELREYMLHTQEGDIAEAAFLNKVTHRWLRGWAADCMQKSYHPRSIQRKWAAIRAFFAFHLKEGSITQNPATRLILPKAEKKLPSFLQEKETEKLFETVTFEDNWEGARDKCILELLYGCGIRRAELINLRLQDIDFHANILNIIGKGKKPRRVPFGKNVAQALHHYIEKITSQGMNLDGFFFVKSDNKPLYENLVYRIVRPYISLVSTTPKRGPHVFRHTYATHLLNAGADLNDIKTLLGHASLAATQIYTHNSIAKLKSIHSLAHPRAITLNSEEL